MANTNGKAEMHKLQEERDTAVEAQMGLLAETANLRGKMHKLQEERDTFKAEIMRQKIEREELAKRLMEAEADTVNLGVDVRHEQKINKDWQRRFESIQGMLKDSQRGVRILTGDVKIQQDRIVYLEERFDEMKALFQEAKEAGCDATLVAYDIAQKALKMGELDLRMRAKIAEQQEETQKYYSEEEVIKRMNSIE